MDSSVTDPVSELFVEGARICVFVGAGVSSASETPSGESPLSWEELVEHIQSCCEEKLDVSIKGAKWLEGESPLLKGEAIMQAITSHFESVKVDVPNGSTDSPARFAEEFLYDEVRNAVDCIGDEYVNGGKVVDAIRDLKPNVVVTTNYDGILERNLQDDEKLAYSVWSYPDRVSNLCNKLNRFSHDELTLGDLLRGGELIAKIHGSVYHEDPKDKGSLVFSESQFRKAYSPDAPVSNFLRAIFATHQVIFVGYSLRDPQLREILASAGALRGQKLQHLLLQKEESVVPKNLARYYQSEYALRVIGYKDHDELAKELARLALALDPPTGNVY